MAYYGGPDIGIEYTFVAVKPFAAEHPIGSGKTVWYQPGDEFPGEEWGNAAHNLVEVGKAVRLAVNVVGKGSEKTSPVALEQPVAEEMKVATSEVTSYPIVGKAGWFELSDGTKIRGQEAALEAQAILDEGGA